MMARKAMMAVVKGPALPSYLSSTQATHATTVTSLTISTPSDATSSTLLCVIIGVDGAADTVATPSGWTLNYSGTTNAAMYVFERMHNGSTATWTFTKTGTSNQTNVVCLAIDNADNLQLGVGGAASGTTPQAQTFTVNQNNSLGIIAFNCTANDSGGAVPSGWTEAQYCNSNSSDMRVFYKNSLYASGSTGTVDASSAYGASRTYARWHGCAYKA